LLSAVGGIDQAVFADGTVWTRGTLLALATCRPAAITPLRRYRSVTDISCHRN